MTTYKPKPKTYNLQFDDGRLEGLEVTLRSLPIGVLFELDELAGNNTRESIDRLFGIVADALQSWNVVDDDEQPVPATKAGLYTQEPELVHEIVDAWRDAMSGVPDPLPETSGDGETSLEESMPMESMSPSLAS